MLIGALAVLTVLAVVVLVVRGSGQTPADAGGTEETTTPSTVDLVAEDLVGRPVRDVQAELVGRGLQVSVVPVEMAEVPAGQVLSVDPVGSLSPDTVVTVDYAVPPVVVPAPPAQEGVGNGNGGNGDEGGGNEGGGDGGKGKGKDGKNDKDDD